MVKRFVRLPSVLLLPISVPPSSINIPFLDNGKDLLVYMRRKNDTTSDPILVVSSDQGNPPPSVPISSIDCRNDDDFPLHFGNERDLVLTTLSLTLCRIRP